MEREDIFQLTLRQLLAPIVPFLDDPAVNEIMINGPDIIYIERNGRLELTEARFEDAEALEAAAKNLAQYINQRITPQTARFDARLPDGSRVHVVMPRVARNGLTMAIRKFARQHITLEGMVETGSLTAAAQEYIETVVALERNIAVCGGAGAGKTSMLNAISEKLPAASRIICIEDVSELQLRQPHVVRLETSHPDRHGNGEVTIRDLLHSSLRMRPDRIIVGEVRGGEAIDMLQALNTGHEGSLSTWHANTPADALNRLETMALMSGLEIPLFALRSQIASAIHMIIQMERLHDGRRIVTAISEVGSLTPEGRYQAIPMFQRWLGHQDALEWTETKSLFGKLLRQKNVEMPSENIGRVFF